MSWRKKMEDNYSRIKRYRDELEKVKNELAQAEGRKKELLERLKEEFQISSVEKAKETLQSLRDKLAKMERDFDKKMKYIEQTYEL